MTTNMTSATAFDKVLNAFCAYNYYNRCWFLFALYLRREEKLHVLYDYNGAKVNQLSTPLFRGSLSGLFNTIDWDTLFTDTSANSVTVVGDLESNPELEKIFNIFVDYSRPKGSYDEGLNGLAQMSKDEEASDMLVRTAMGLLGLDSEWLNKNFLTLFDKAMRRILALSNIDSHFQPIEVTRLAASLIGKVEGRLYNPFAGVGSYGVVMRDRMSYLGEEINPTIAAIGNLRLLSQYVDGEILTSRALMGEAPYCDAAIATPPFGVKVPFGESYDQGTHDYETLTLWKFAWLNVKSVVVVSQHVCYSGGYCKNLRENLINRGCIDLIISLPAGIFSSTGVKTSIFVLNPNHNHNGYVRFVDATNCISDATQKGILDVSKVIEILNSNTASESTLVSVDEIKSKDYNLDAFAYIHYESEIQEGYKFFRIGDLGTITQNHASSEISTGLFATFNKLSNINKLKIFGPQDFEEASLPSSALQIDTECLMMSGARGLRGVAVNPEGHELFGHANYFCFNSDTTKLNPQYLLLQLQKEYLKSQLGHTPTITVSKERFSNLEIALPVNEDGTPDLETQDILVKEYTNDLIISLGMEVDVLKQRRFEEYQKDMRMRKHQIAQRLNDIIPSSDVLASFIASQKGEFDKHIIVSQFSGTDLESYARKLYNSLLALQDLIVHFTDDKSFSDAEEVNLYDFTKDFKVGMQLDKYDLQVPADTFAKDESEEAEVIKNLRVPISRKDLSTVFENIISNAEKYGFVDERRYDYAIRMNISRCDVEGDKEMAIISIDNNGALLPRGMSAKKMFTWGVGLGSGIGMWQARHIVEHFGGRIDFHQEPDKDDGFCIRFEILLPIVTD